jgi:type IV secretion system protein VirD4
MIEKARALIGALVALTCRIVLIAAIGVIALAVGMICLRFPLWGCILLGWMGWRRFHHRDASYSYGSAHTASVYQMQRGGLFADHGVILGRSLPESPSLRAAALGLFSPWISSDTAVRSFLARLFGTRWLSGRLLRVNNHVHLATFSPAGGGKGVGVLIPNLLSYRGNCVIVDPKGELYRATAERRRKKFGHRIIRIDPFNVCGPGGDTLNPIDSRFVDSNADDFLDRMRDVSNGIIIRQHDEKDPHWNDSAELLLTALCSFVAGCEHDEKRRNLGTVRALAASREKHALAVDIMQKSDAAQGAVRRLGGLLTWQTGEEQSSILSTFNRQTAFLDSPAVARNVASSSFDPMVLRQEPADIYLILPHNLLNSLSRLQRLWIGCIMRRVTSGVPTEKSPVLWLLDEMAHIGPMPAIEDAVTLMRGMGMRLWFIFQSLGQLKTCFGEKAPTVLDNIGTQQYFGINSYETAEEISKRIGDATIGNISVNDTSGGSHSTGGGAQSQGGNRSYSRSVTTSDMARRLLKPEEVLTLPDDVVLIFHKNLPVCVGRLVKFFNAPEFRWGGTARPRRLGLAAAIMAAFTLVVSGVLAAGLLAWAGIRLPYGAGMMARDSRYVEWQPMPVYYPQAWPVDDFW